ncbi:MAG: hypothetical protein V4498_07760 [candidate division FCPU426 bacterium]
MVTKKVAPKKPAKKKPVAKLKAKAVPMPVATTMKASVVVPAPVTKPFKDRGLTLAMIGTMDVLMGLACLGMTLLMMSVPNLDDPTDSSRTRLGAVMAGGIYGILAVALVWIGIGLFMARRWARAISLIFAWFWLLVGVVAVPLMAYVMPKVLGTVAADKGLDEGIQSWTVILMVGFMAFVFILLPGIQVLALQSSNVKKTCETRDPKTRWTDRCPLPVLAVVIGLAYSSVAMLFYPWIMKAYPVFGVILQGPLLWALFICVAAASATLALGAYRLRHWAWRGTMAFMILWILSSAISFNNGSTMAAMQAGGMMKPQGAEWMAAIFQGQGINLLLALSLIAYGGYWINCKKYFKAA